MVRHTDATQNKLFLLLLLAGTFTFFSSFVKGQPEWVSKTPLKSNYFIGVGGAEKISGSSGHIQKARDRALEQIASGIAVTITSEASQKLLDQAGIVKEKFEITITSMARAELQGYELVDSWENEDEYWVYFQLHKNQYHLWLTNRKQVATLKASEYLAQAEHAINRKKITPAIGFYLQALGEIAPFLGMGLPASEGTMNTFLDVKILTNINLLFSSITISSSPSSLNAKVFQATPEKITLEVHFYLPDGSKIPVENLPLEAAVLQGSCTFDKPFPTDSSGLGLVKISHVHGPDNIQLVIKPDILALAGVSKEIAHQLTETISLPEKVISVVVDPVKVLIITRETNLDEHQQRPVTEGTLKQFLTSNGWSIVDEARLADYVIYVHAHSRQGSLRQGIYTAFAWGEISLVDNLTQEEIKRKTFSEINSGGSSYQLAGSHSLRRLAEEMTREFDAWFE